MYTHGRAADPSLNDKFEAGFDSLDNKQRNPKSIYATIIHTPPPISVYCVYLKSCILCFK